MASTAIDAFITFRFLKLLVTPFNKTEAFKLGIINDRGKVLKKYKTLERIEERQAYTILHRLVFNVKKLIEKVPGGKSRLASYAAPCLGGRFKICAGWTGIRVVPSF